MKIRMECVTVQRAAAPLNKNDSRISRNDFVMLRLNPKKSEQAVWLSIRREALPSDRRIATSVLVRFTQAVYLDCSFAKRLLKCATVQCAFCLIKWHSAKVKCYILDKGSKLR